MVHRWDKWPYVDYQRPESPEYVIVGQVGDATVVAVIKSVHRAAQGSRSVSPGAATGIVAAFPRGGFGTARLGFAPESWSKESSRYGFGFGYAAKPNDFQTPLYLSRWKQNGFERIALEDYPTGRSHRRDRSFIEPL